MYSCKNSFRDFWPAVLYNPLILMLTDHDMELEDDPEVAMVPSKPAADMPFSLGQKAGVPSMTDISRSVTPTAQYPSPIPVKRFLLSCSQDL